MATKTTVKKEIEVQPLEVEIIIPEDVLKKESHFKDVYLNGKLKYDFGNELPENVKENISEILKTSKVNEIVMFNPLLVALTDLEKIKDLKYDAETDNERDYIDSNKKIGSFNTSVKAVTKDMRKDADEYIKKIKSINDFLLTEAQTTRNILEENFKPLLDARAKKKQEAEDKKNKAILEANQKLVQQNEEQAKKIKNQQKESKKLTIQGEIGKITFSATSGVSMLNLDGLTKLQKELEGKVFSDLISDADQVEYNFSEDEVFELQNEFNNAVSTSLKAVKTAVENIKTNEENKELKSENEVMKAQQPSNLLSDNNDVPFQVPSPEPIVVAGISDKDKITVLATIVERFNQSVLEFHNEIEGISFDDVGLQKVHDIVAQSSFGQIKEWSSKLVTWTNTKKEAYLQHLNNQK